MFHVIKQFALLGALNFYTWSDSVVLQFFFCIWDLPSAAEIHVAVRFSVSYDAAYKNSIQNF